MISGVTSVKHILSLFVVGAIHLFIKYNSCNYWINIIGDELLLNFGAKFHM